MSRFLVSRLILTLSIATSLTVAHASGEPCVIASSSCTEWLHLQGQSRSLIYRTYPLEQNNEKITRALVMVHGAGRDADNYFRTALAAAFLGGALDDTEIVAPRFASNSGTGCKDKLAENEVNWSCSGDSWRSGGTSVSDKSLTSYDFMDELLRQLANKRNFPNLRVIVVAGHSAGGQFVTRYQMANKLNEQLGVAVQYIVSNPSSYAYPDAMRPSPNGSFTPFPDARNCTTFDNWPYGLKNRSGYALQISDEQLIERLQSRPVTYLLGEIDILPLGGFDSSCPAMAQGPTRLARGQAFQRYVAEKYKVNQKITVVPLCGHNARCMFTAEPALPILFPKP